MENLPERIFLCGFMGAGKTTVGNALARKLDLPFLDLDRFVEKEAGTDIPSIFEKEGEKEFRKREQKALLKVISEFEGVLALGGGTLQNQHIVDHVKLNGILVFIETPLSVILERIGKQTGRPLLLNEKGSPKDSDLLKTEMEELYQQRLSYYKQAVIHIDSSNFKTMEQLLDKLVRKLKNYVSNY